jgi:hypothetical protein
MIQERIESLAEAYAAEFEPMFRKVARRAYIDGMTELAEFVNLAYEMREAQKEYHRLRYSQHKDKIAEIGERMSDLQRTVDAELRDILALED